MAEPRRTAFWEGRRVAVTGGAGFIGSNLVARLVGLESTVTVLDNLSSGYSVNLAPFPSVRFVNGDVRDARTVSEAFAGADTVFHLAASVGNKRSLDNPIEDAEVNVLGTIQVLEAARRLGIRKVVVSSSAGIFGELKTLPIREDHAVEPDSPYGCTKLCEEKLSLAYARLYGFDAVCLRYFNVFGPNQRFDAYGNVIPIFVFQMLRGETLTIFGDGEQTRDFVHVSDVVQANLLAAEREGVSGAFNLGSGTRVTINRLVELIADASGGRPSVRYGPQRPGDVRDSLADISAAQRTLGYRPSAALHLALAEDIYWARQEQVRAMAARAEPTA